MPSKPTEHLEYLNDLEPGLRAQLVAAPKSPGVYIFRNGEKKVLYVGKSVNLRSRVRAYFAPHGDSRASVPFIRQEVASVEFIITDNENDALVLENNLVTKFKPRYNIMLKDDKTFINVCVTTKHEWPRVLVVRRYKKDGNTYVGPFTSALSIRRTLDLLKRVYPLRLCNDSTLNNRTRPCLYHEIGQCSAPCVDGHVTKEEYAELVENTLKVLRGKDDGLTTQLAETMREHAANLNFEQAAAARDRLKALKAVLAMRTPSEQRDRLNRDILGVYRAGEELQIHLLFYRDGKLLDSASHLFKSPLPDSEVLRQFVTRFYSRTQNQTPSEIVLPIAVDEMEGLEAWLTTRAGHRVSLTAPSRGAMRDLVELANTNARHGHKDLLALEAREETLLQTLQEKLKLKHFPERMECYDISTIQGRHTVGSQVTFLHGRPAKEYYRRYRISPENAGDDFAAMREVLTRRARRSMEGDPLPDLIVIDGGPPQLEQALKALEEADVVNCDVVGLAKGRPRRKAKKKLRHESPERIWRVGAKAAIPLPKDDAVTYLLQRLRDEAHRFAITYHRKLRSAEFLESTLEGVPGVGPKRRHALINAFGSTRAVKEASLEALEKVDGITPNLARDIFEHFRNETDNAESPAEGEPQV